MAYAAVGNPMPFQRKQASFNGRAIHAYVPTRASLAAVHNWQAPAEASGAADGLRENVPEGLRTLFDVKVIKLDTFGENLVPKVIEQLMPTFVTNERERFKAIKQFLHHNIVSYKTPSTTTLGANTTKTAYVPAFLVLTDVRIYACLTKKACCKRACARV